MKRKFLLIAAIVCALPLFVNAQFNSGSTGADGALDLSTMTCPSGVCEVQLPESGILNYTTVNIPQDKELRFKFNSRNTPVILLAQGNIIINGKINISGGLLYGDSKTPGPGGFYGGETRQRGFGPGGGQLVCDQVYGNWVGSLTLVPIVGGSGSAGKNCSYQGDYPGPGGGGGGGIVLASTTTITMSLSSTVTANGSPAYTAGSGGAIRIVSNSINISGNLFAREGNPGIIRIEAPAGQRNFSGTANPTPVFAEINPVITPTNPPTLTIASIGGYAVPSYSAGRPDRVDLMLPTQLTDPIPIVIQGTNVPSGTQVQLQLSGSSGTATGCTLTGGPGPVSCNASVSGLNRNGVSTLLAVAVFDPSSQAAVFNPKGENQVAKVRLETALGKQSKYAFLRANGSEIDAKKLSPQFLQQFGM